ncbi:Uncharacterised protein [Legionella lansingensis]|uniref:Uncharacterized protein n=1 Tax=Legionella lansingensis TaxID=45067 RepID=A0A0W0VLH7_9GAMM|nr:hypothetical protein [Legionella lansingensis]KTD20929.1 hypothetical protein Llan_1659 [Legionella lansingensis]SNV44340.1 Uncharacterised protein [Legionella lansingensis]
MGIDSYEAFLKTIATWNTSLEMEPLIISQVSSLKSWINTYGALRSCITTLGSSHFQIAKDFHHLITSKQQLLSILEWLPKDKRGSFLELFPIQDMIENLQDFKNFLPLLNRPDQAKIIAQFDADKLQCSQEEFFKVTQGEMIAAGSGIRRQRE